MSEEKEYSVFDGVISLGAWCQMGAASRVRGLHIINSPFHNFGIKWWQNVLDILDKKFDEYWERKNISIGKAVENYSAKYNDKRLVYKVYCNKYYMMSNHHFDQEDNTPTELLTYSSFKEKIDVLIDVFYAQCEQYETMLFLFKALSYPRETEVSRADLVRFCSVLDTLRAGKSYELRISVPAGLYTKVCQWVEEEKLKQITVYKFDINFNDDFNHSEFAEMLDDVKLAEDYYERLNRDIFEITDPYSQHISYLNS